MHQCITALLVGLHLLLSLASVTNSQNVTVDIAPEENVTFSCPDGSSIVNIYSYYDYQTFDRYWQFDCSIPIPAGPHPQLDLVQLGWLNSFNEIAGILHVVCPNNNSLISGIASNFYVDLVDRVWQIQCSRVPEQQYIIRDCEWTEGTDSWDNISVSGAVAGAYSIYHSFTIDRSWKFLICSLAAVYCEELPTLPHGSVSFPSGSGLYPNTVQFECHDGFYLEGPLSANCTKEREWTEVPTCGECSSIRFCAELVCTTEGDSVCQQCDPFSPSGHALVLDKEKNRCEAPPIITQNKSIVIIFEAGDTIVLPCEATGIPTPQITWLKEGWPMEVDSPQIRFHDHHMTIDNITYFDTGVYQCVATNSMGADNATVLLSGNDPPPYSSPTVVDWNSVYPYTVDLPAWLHCSILGYPPPIGYWLKTRLGQITVLPETNDTSSRIIQYSNNTLKFTEIKHSDSGVYTCLVTNGYEEALRQTVVFVHDDPNSVNAPSHGKVAAKITLWMDEYTVMEGGSVELLCGSDGVPSPEWVWLTGEGCALDSYPNGSLILSNMSIAAGREQHFQCIVWNDVGLEEKYATVTVYIETAVVIAPTHTFGVATVTPTIFPSSSSIFVPSPLLTTLLLLLFLSV